MPTIDDNRGYIAPQCLYTLDSFKLRLGIKDATLRAARRAGLQVYHSHGRGYILGREWIRYVRSSTT
jgi:hypothetical protein